MIEQLKKKETKVILICGEDDGDCLPQCRKFETAAADMGLDINSIYIKGLGHEYPEDFQKIVQQFIN